MRTTNEIQSIEVSQLDTVTGGCSCGCGSASCSCTNGSCGGATTTTPAVAAPATTTTGRTASSFRSPLHFGRR